MTDIFEEALKSEHLEYDWMYGDEAKPAPLGSPGDNDFMYKIPDELEGGPYIARLVPAEEGGYVCEVLGCEGCLSEGDTLEEAKVNIRDALKAWLETVRKEEPAMWKQFLAVEKREEGGVKCWW